MKSLSVTILAPHVPRSSVRATLWRVPFFRVALYRLSLQAGRAPFLSSAQSLGIAGVASRMLCSTPNSAHLHPPSIPLLSLVMNQC